MTSSPIDLPTLRNHHSYLTIKDRQIPVLYRLKLGTYYPYVAFDLVVSELLPYCSTWSSSAKLPLISMTSNEQTLYRNLCPEIDFSSTSKLILCALVDQYLQLIDLLKEASNKSLGHDQEKFAARFLIDSECGCVKDIDLRSAEETKKFNHLRSTLFPSMRTVKRQLCFDDAKFDLPSVGGYLQLDRCIYPYIISSSDILLNLNDLRKPFDATLHLLLPYFHVQPAHLITNYMRIVDYGTRSIKKYKYYYKNVDEKFISLNHLLLLHRSLLFIQLFNSNRVPLTELHEYYRTDFSTLLSNSLSTCGYFNDQPCLDIWSLFDSTVNSEMTSRLATPDETILINWLLIYGNRADRVHHQVDDLVLVKQDPSSMRDKVTFIQSEHMRKRSTLTNILNT